MIDGEGAQQPAAGLFSPWQMRGTTLKNRIVVAPMWQYSGLAGFPSAWHSMHLGRLAAGGAGLVIQEATAVERRGCGTVGDLGIWDDRFIAPLSQLVAHIKALGSVPAIQLAHAGRKARRLRPWEGKEPLAFSPEIPDWDSWELVAPSAIADGPGFEVPRALSRSEIADVVAAWGLAAGRANAAGYEALEIHAGHGYLLHQFLSPGANERTDDYGGSLGNRIRLVMEVVEAVRARWPAEKPLIVRLSCVDNAGWSLEDTVSLCRQLKPLGVDLIDCTSGGVGGSPIAGGVSTANRQVLSYGYQVGYADRIRQSGIPTMAVGLIVHADQADTIIRQGQADLVALARELLMNPNWPIDAAGKLGIADSYKVAPANVGHWLRSRAKSFPGLEPSTWRRPEMGPS